MQTVVLIWHLFFFVYPFNAFLLQPSRELKPAPETKSSLHLALDDKVQIQTVIGDFSKERLKALIKTWYTDQII